MSRLVLREVVKIIEIDPILVGEEEIWFRIEVCREQGNSNHFTARTWRREHHQIGRVLVDSSHLFEEVVGKTEKEVIDRTLQEIETRFVKAK